MGKNETLIKIERYMKERNWSLYRLAKEADLPYSSLSNLFQRNNEPTLYNLKSICAGLGISLSEFFSDEILPSVHEYSHDERELISLYEPLNRTDKKLLLTYAYALNRLIPKQDEPEE